MHLKFKIITFLFLLCQCTLQLYGQNTQDQLSKLHLELANAPNDTIRMDVYNSIGLLYAETNRDSSIWYRKKSLELAQKLQLKINEADILVGQGYILLTLDNYPEALRALNKAVNILENNPNAANPFTFTNGQSDVGSGESTLAVARFVLGLLYRQTGNVSSLIDIFNSTIQIAEVVQDTSILSLSYMFLAETYYDMAEIDTALYFLEKSMPLFLNSNLKYKGVALVDYGKIYLKQGDLVAAKKVLKEAIEMGESYANEVVVADASLMLSELFLESNKIDSSLIYAEKALAIYRKIKLPTGIAEANENLSQIYLRQKNNAKAIYYLNESKQISDSLHKVEKNRLLEFQNIGFDEQIRLEELEKESIQVKAEFRIYVLSTAIGLFILISFFLFRISRNRKRANEQLQQQKDALQDALNNLKSTQNQLIHAEKMASLGELTAGIAHEIQNPLNFVNNFSELNKELIDEQLEEMEKGDFEEAKELAQMMKANGEKINHHGKRADAIVKGMLAHSRTSSGEKVETDINAIADEYLRLSYHGLRAKDHNFNADFKTDFDPNLPKVNVIPQDIGRVLLNLINNAFQACVEVEEPFVQVATRKTENGIQISVSDNGPGIPENIKDKIFQPFFTTKPTGQGTGLGLSLSYDIIKAHGGSLSISSKTDDSTIFIIHLAV
jgi:signal transduction histidine kinase